MTTSTQQQPPTLSIAEALEGGLTLIKADKWRYHQRKSIESGWERFRSETYPELTSWWDLRPIHLFNFLVFMEDKMGWKRNTISHYQNPLRKASHWVFLNHPDHWKNLFERKMRRNASTTQSDRYLMPDQLKTLIDTAMRMKQPGLASALMFGGLAGLGIAEMADLQIDHIGEDTITITRAKNVYRPRVIPMCAPLKDFSKAFRMCLGAVPSLHSEYLLTKVARRVFDKAAEETGDKTFSMVSLHDATRVTFANIATSAGVPREYLAAYCGHAGETTLEKNYLKLVPKENDLPRIQQAKLDQLRTNVCEPINKKCDNISFF